MARDLKITPLNDRDEHGAVVPLAEIDPFTFLGVFNRGIRREQRLAILAEIVRFLGATSPLPTDFDGIPVLNNQRSWLFSYKADRGADDVRRLWIVFRLAQEPTPLDDPRFAAAFDAALGVRGTNLNLTMGLFWIRPDAFLNLDATNRTHLALKLPPRGLDFAFYRDTLADVRKREPDFPSLSRRAWESLPRDGMPALIPQPAPALPPGIDCWLVGAYWDESEPMDQTERFLAEGVWQNGYEDRFLDQVRAMKMGDRIAIKAATTQRLNLPFDAQGRTVSKMIINAVGTIVANRGDGRTVEVEWEPSEPRRDWYFYTGRSTVWRLNRDNEFAQKLIDFAFFRQPQDHAWFAQRWWDGETPAPPLPDDPVPPEPGPAPRPFSAADVVAQGAFLDEQEIENLCERLRTKKNLILQGPPGVGKTYLARQLAQVVMRETDDTRIEAVQFHQSYTYEDFVRGYRPVAGQAGAFALQDGVFLDFCARAAAQPDKEHFFIIDEINRGNLAQIFGELLVLLEADKRGPRHSVRLMHRRPGEDRFHLPANLHLIGLMNVADRSLALVDYALRRRFAFFDLRPAFERPAFTRWLSDRGMAAELVELIVTRLGALNREIAAHPLLGEPYSVGHSFFCPRGSDFQGLDRAWYESIVRTEVEPLIKEYLHDDRARAREWCEALLR